MEEPVQGSAVDGVAALSVRTLDAGRWRVATMLLQGILQFAVGVLLARLLAPADFGVAALSFVIIGFTVMADLGLGSAIEQRRHLTPRHLRTAFTACLLVGLVISGTLALAAPVIGGLARNSELPPVLRVQGLMFTVVNAGVVPRALLERDLDFRRLFFIDVVSYVVGYALVATLGAIAGWGVWSLVIGSLVQSILSNTIVMAAARPPVRPLIALAELRELLGFGIGVSFNGVVGYVAKNGDNFLVGRLLGAAALGLYARAFNLMMLPLAFVINALPNVLLPAFARVQGDPKRVGRGFLVSVQFTAMVTAPIMAGMIVAAPYMIRGLYGDRWAGAVLPLQILCAVGLPRAIHPLAGAVDRACNRVYAEVWLQIGYAAAVVLGAAVGATRGIGGVATLVSVAILAMYAAIARLALSITGQTWRAFAAAQLPGICLGLTTIALMLPVRLVLEETGLSSLAIFVLLLLAGVVSLPLGLYFLPARVRPEALFRHLRGPLSALPPPLSTWSAYLLPLAAAPDGDVREKALQGTAGRHVEKRVAHGID